MKLTELITQLKSMDRLAFRLPNGQLVPAHFHVTEVGRVQKHFIDCGGKIRQEDKINLQLWSANDYDHRLHPEKLLHILQLSQNKLDLADLEVEVEYQGTTVERYSLQVNGEDFNLTPLFTDCLAKKDCGIPVVEAAQPVQSACCSPNQASSKCC